MLPLLAAALALVFPALVLIAAFKDATSYTIPNWISLGLLAVFPLAALAAMVPLSTIGLNFAVGFGALVIGFILYAMKWFGGGDAKLLAAVALWVGWPAGLTFIIGTTLFGGLLAGLLLAIRSPQMRPVVLLGPHWLVRLSEPGAGIPYGVAIAIGAFFAFPESPLMPGLAH